MTSRRVRPRRSAYAGLEDRQREAGRLLPGVGVAVVDVPGEPHGVPTGEGDALVSHCDGDAALLDLEQLMGAGGVRLARVGLAGPERPVPQLDDIGRLRSAANTPRPPLSPVHKTAPSPLRITCRGVLFGGSTSDGSPTPRASLRRSSVPTLGLAAPCSTLTSIRRLTRAASANRSRVHRRARRSWRPGHR